MDTFLSSLSAFVKRGYNVELSRTFWNCVVSNAASLLIVHIGLNPQSTLQGSEMFLRLCYLNTVVMNELCSFGCKIN